MIERTITPRRRDLGGGFEVARLLPSPWRRMVGPFAFFDRFGPVNLPPGIPRSMDVRPHPHIGLSTLTYLFDGEIMHRDSLGSQQAVRPGEVNWMTAGRGITHSERFERARAEGGPLSGIQVWIALPRELEEIDPSFTHYGESSLPAFGEPGMRGRVIAGEAFGLRASVNVHSPMFYVHCELDAGGCIALPAHMSERAAYVSRGAIEVGGRTVETGQMVVFGAKAPAQIAAREPATVMLLGGEPVGERYIEWNFVSSSKERIEQAKADWRAGRMKLPDFDNEEFIPLPDDSPPANPMS